MRIELERGTLHVDGLQAFGLALMVAGGIVDAVRAAGVPLSPAWTIALVALGGAISAGRNALLKLEQPAPPAAPAPAAAPPPAPNNDREHDGA